MANVVIDDSHLHAIGDALRSKLGESHKEEVVETIHHPEGMCDMEPIIVKTPNATGFDTFEGSYDNNMDDYQVVSVPGAAKLRITVAYQTESTNYDYLQIDDGDMTGQTITDRGKKGGTTLTQETMTWVVDTITFYFHSDSSQGNYLGYYAEVIGLDADGNVMQELKEAWDEEITVEVDVPNVYKPRDMAEAISSMNVQMKYAEVYSSDGLSFDLSPYINDDDKFILFYSQRFRTSTSSDKYNGIFTTFFDKEHQTKPHYFYPNYNNLGGITAWSSLNEVSSAYHAVGYYNKNYSGVTVSFENGILTNSHGVGISAILVYVD